MKRHQQPRVSLAPLLIGIVSVSAMWCIYWVIVSLCIPSDAVGAWNVRGQFGDMFGAFNALITATGFAGLLYTIHLQRHDVQQQTRALRHQELMTALTAQLNTLIQIQAMPDDKRHAAWEAIASAPGGPGQDFPIERAIAIQVQYLDRLAQGEEISTIPTYGLEKPDA